MAALIAAYPGKAAVKISAVQIAVDYVQPIGTPKTVSRFIATRPGHFKLFKVVLHTAIVARSLWIAGLIKIIFVYLKGCN
jgi:hypothetical protein